MYAEQLYTPLCMLCDPNKDDFAMNLIKALGLPVTPQNFAFIKAWMQSEGTKAQNNPLATTWKKPGSTYFNCLKRDATGQCSAGVQNYPTQSLGIQATVDTLHGNKIYEPILLALYNNQTSVNPNDLGLKKAFDTWGTTYNLFMKNFSNVGTVSQIDTRKNLNLFQKISLTALGVYGGYRLIKYIAS